MNVKIIIKKASETGFCYGVRRAISIMEKAAAEHGRLETLGAVVHNEQVTRQLNEAGVSVVNNIEEIKSQVAAISAHGVSPLVEAQLREKVREVIDTTCPLVRRAQKAAQKLAEAGFWVVIFGEAQHTEVKGILGWAREKGTAVLSAGDMDLSQKLPNKIGIISQTTQIPERFIHFVKEIVDLTLNENAELHIIDTICRDVRQRQAASLELAGQVDLMLVVGGHSSANTRRLAEICSSITETHLIGSAEEIKPGWLEGKKAVGVTSGTSTPDFIVDEVVKCLEVMTDTER